MIIKSLRRENPPRRRPCEVSLCGGESLRRDIRARGAEWSKTIPYEFVGSHHIPPQGKNRRGNPRTDARRRENPRRDTPQRQNEKILPSPLDKATQTQYNMNTSTYERTSIK